MKKEKGGKPPGEKKLRRRRILFLWKGGDPHFTGKHREKKKGKKRKGTVSTIAGGKKGKRGM